MEICVKYLLKRKRLGKREERAVVLASDLIKHKREVEKLINRSKNRMAKLLNLLKTIPSHPYNRYRIVRPIVEVEMKALLDNLNFLKDVAGFYEIRVDEDFKANLYSLKLSVEKKNFPTFEDMELIYPLSKRDYYELLFKTRSFPVN